MKIITFIFICFIVLACENEQRIDFACENEQRIDSIPSAFYNIKYAEDPIRVEEIKGIFGSRIDYDIIEERIFPPYILKNTLTENKKHFVFKNDAVEIMLTREVKFLTSPDKKYLYNFLVGIYNGYCYYIFWPYGEAQDINKKDDILDWHINKKTKLVFTNIDNDVFRKLFTEFEGRIEHPEISEIHIAHRKKWEDFCYYYMELHLIGFDEMEIYDIQLFSDYYDPNW